MAEEKKEYALHLDASEYKDKILKGSLPALVDFWAPWCFPCRMLAPTIEELAKEYEGRVVVAKVNTDQNGELANSLDIKGIPTMLFIKDGQIVDKMTGAAAKHIIAGKLEKLIEQPKDRVAMSPLAAFLRENLFFLAVLLLIAAAFIFLRTEPSAIASLGELESAVASGRPAIIEFYSNT